MTDSSNPASSTPQLPTSPATANNEPQASGVAAEQSSLEPVPTELQTPANTTGQQPFAHNPNHEQNEVAGASRGEFGRQSDQGITQGGYGAELSRGNATYAGTLDTPVPTTGYIGERQQQPNDFVSNENGSYGTQPVGATAPSGSAVGTDFANDNAAPKGTDSGYAENYGTSSLGEARAGSGQPDASHRNQQEDYRPNHPEGGPEGLRTGVAPTNTSQGSNEADATPTRGSRSGYQAAGSPDAQGGQQSGFGSKGGSYNDEYASAAPNDQQEGAPTRGDYDSQDAARNYGGASDDRTGSGEGTDYGPMPTRSGGAD
ncbi:hypothetical protein [Hymenobacter sublimis]|uniref:Uncharacterized protein n=1 Tax=Hymenobacter sublimis TaxID=2933777 RepID=A0ABY4J644_9BACT|nr:hypothetical protein [Hymenobacter sublimis]UPL48295.1 hypothetical protein MWH26_13990 [Hymenobacter sublimis]